MKTWLGLGSLSGSVLALFAVFASACSSSTPDKPFPDVASFCQAKAKEECQIAPTCAVDSGACQIVREQLCNADALLATAPGARKYTQDNAPDCINKVHDVYAAGKVLVADLVGDGSITDKCSRVFVGTTDKNKLCTNDFDCASDRVCTPAQPGAPQLVCADKVSKSQGDFCADPGSECATGTYCASSTAAAAQCQARGQHGTPCSATQPCLESLTCSAGTCTDRSGPGKTCATNDDCSPTAGYCDPYAANICTVGLTFATGSLDCKGYGTSVIPVDAGGGALDGGSPDTGPSGIPDAFTPDDAPADAPTTG